MAEDPRPTDQLAAGAALPDWVILPDCPTGKCSPNARLHAARLVARRYLSDRVLPVLMLFMIVSWSSAPQNQEQKVLMERVTMSEV